MFNIPQTPFFLDFLCDFRYQHTYRPAAAAAYSYIRSLERCDYASTEFLSRYGP